MNTVPERQNWFPLLLGWLPFILILWIGYRVYKNMQGGMGGQGGLFSIGKSKAKIQKREHVSTTFEDVAGAEEAKHELREVVEYLKNPERFARFGADIPKGMLLVGPPGTGKTLLARAVAGEADVTFFSITGSDFMEMFVGVGAARVRDMFKQAKENAPSIIFIDELDSIGRQRGAGLGGGHDEREQTLNQLLSEMDGFEPNVNVIVLAATNRPDILDGALLRPGRFDRRITVPLPTQKDRIAILKIHARNKPLSEDVDLREIARGTPGFSGADLANLLNEAALIAAEQEKEKIAREDIHNARDNILLGLARTGLALTDDEKKTIALHEAGHAVVAAVLPHTDPLHKVSIIPRGKSMGVTQQLPERDRYLYDKRYLLNRLVVMMGGRAAEKIRMESLTSGAEDDLKQAQIMARKMVLDWGMSDQFENIAFGSQRREVFLGEQISQGREYSEDTARRIDEEVEKILIEVFERAVKLLREHESELESVTRLLFEEEEVDGGQIYSIVESRHSTPEKGIRIAGRQK